MWKTIIFIAYHNLFADFYGAGWISLQFAPFNDDVFKVQFGGGVSYNNALQFNSFIYHLGFSYSFESYLIMKLQYTYMQKHFITLVLMAKKKLLNRILIGVFMQFNKKENILGMQFSLVSEYVLIEVFLGKGFTNIWINKKVQNIKEDRNLKIYQLKALQFINQHNIYNKSFMSRVFGHYPHSDSDFEVEIEDLKKKILLKDPSMFEAYDASCNIKVKELLKKMKESVDMNLIYDLSKSELSLLVIYLNRDNPYFCMLPVVEANEEFSVQELKENIPCLNKVLTFFDHVVFPVILSNGAQYIVILNRLDSENMMVLNCSHLDFSQFKTFSNMQLNVDAKLRSYYVILFSILASKNLLISILSKSLHDQRQCIKDIFGTDNLNDNLARLIYDYLKNLI